MESHEALSAVAGAGWSAASRASRADEFMMQALREEHAEMKPLMLHGAQVEGPQAQSGLPRTPGKGTPGHEL